MEFIGTLQKSRVLVLKVGYGGVEFMAQRFESLASGGFRV